MKRSLLTLLLLAFFSTGLIAETSDPIKQASSVSCSKNIYQKLREKRHKRHHSKQKQHPNISACPSPCLPPCPVPPCAATPISEATTITQSGNYCLTQDIIGAIEIAADNVTLDLNSFLVNGNGEAAAITTSGFNNIIIKNGSVTNPESIGISANEATALLVEAVQIFGSDQALVLSGCRSSDIKSVKAYDNFNTFVDPTTFIGTAVVLIDNCENIELTDVQANNNTKELTDSVGTVDPGVGIISVNNSHSVTLTGCTTNNNKRTNNNCRFAPLVGLFSTSVKFINCESNNNFIPIEDTRGFAPIHFRVSFDTVIDCCQANGNEQRVGTSNIFRPIYVIATSRNVIKNSQANDNFCKLLSTSGLPDLTGIMLFATTGFQSDSFISHCQVSGNIVANGGADRQTGSESNLFGILLEGRTQPAGFENRTVIEYCQINNNQMHSHGDFQFVQGIQVINDEDVTIANCSCDGNGGGAAAAGILIEGFPLTEGIKPVSRQPVRNCRIINCTANDTHSRHLAFGIGLIGFLDSESGLTGVIENAEITDCQANNSRTSIGRAGYGITLADNVGCAISYCQMDGNSHSGLVAGIEFPFTSLNPNQINKNCSILNCSANDNGLHGFELSDIGTNRNFLLQNNIALGNGGFGFLHSPAVLTSRYLGNYASENRKGGFSITGGSIQLFSLDATGFYTSVSGDPDHFSYFSNVVSVP